MADATLIALIQELMDEYDSTIDTSSGSSFYTSVITPLMTRIGDDPLDADPEALIVAHLEENIDGIDVSPKSGNRNLLAQPFQVMVEPWNRSLAGVKAAMSLDNYQAMTRDELNALLANYFIDLNDGEKSLVTIRMYFLSPQTAVVTSLRQFSTGTGLNFFPTATQSLTSTSMSFNKEDGLYYMDVTCQAENAGTEYDVSRGEINSVTGVAGVIRVTNKSAATSGSNAETKLEGITRARESITTRTLAVLRGCKTVLQAEFASIDDIEVVGGNDELMLRDVLTGPLTISGIPGGFVGFNPLDIGSGNSVHIGGKTDVWLFTKVPVEETVDLQNVTDKGTRIMKGTHAFTDPGATTTLEWEDLYGAFTLWGVASGDFLRYGDTEIEIDSVGSDSELTLAATVAGALSSQTYEIVRYESGSPYQTRPDNASSTSGFWYEVPLHALVAVDSDGVVVLDDDGDVVIPTPGALDRSAWTDGSGDYVKAEDNIADANLQLPLVRIKSVVFLDPLDSLVETGEVIPLADVLRIQAQGAFTGGASGVKATGIFRVYFRDAVNVFFDPDTWRGLADDTVVYYQTTSPVDLTGITVNLTGTGAGDTSIEIESLDTTGDLTAGDRIKIGSYWWTITAAGTYAAGDTTYASVREEYSGSSSTAAAVAASGILEDDMAADDTGLYYFDVAGQATSNGTSGNIADGTRLATTSASGIYAEGYTTGNVESELAYSVKEQVVLKVSRFVNDDVDLDLPSTAYALRVYYDYADGYTDLQDYVESPENRPVGGDILIRHMLPSYVLTSMTTDLGVTAAQDAVIDFFLGLDPTVDFQISDLIDHLYESEATYVQAPVTAVVMDCGRDRKWAAEVVTDTHTTSRINHYLADSDSITLA
jgi:hypothetical protein